MLQIHASALALMQLLTDLPPLQHGDVNFLIWTPVYTVQYN